MRKLALLLSLVFLGVFPGKVAAYELATHARITLQAFEQSSLATDPQKIPNLGLPSLLYTELGSNYYDVAAGVARVRSSFQFDYSSGRMPNAVVEARITGWLMRGAIREDDAVVSAGLGLISQLFGAGGGVQPLDDPDGNINRFCRHFFDPFHASSGDDGGLSDASVLSVLGCGTSSMPAIRWASGTYNPLLFLPLEDPSRRNHFTILDAREAMWRALTGYDKDLGARVAATGLERKAYWATVFRSLGDVLHLNQDMAQPQHTRNESHPVKPGSLFESYIEARSIPGTVYQVSSDGVRYDVVNLPDLTYSGYPTPRFHNYSRYWTTGVGAASQTGKGLADYSNHGFFTTAHNFGDPTFSLPTSNPSAYVPETRDDVFGTKAEYLLGDVRDEYTASTSRIRATRKSHWAGDDGIPSDLYIPDLGVFDDHASLLIPHAVAYSAGLLDYFFNGALEISLPAEGAYAVVDHSTGGGTQGFTQILMNLKNVTPPLMDGDVSFPQNMTGGQAVAVVKFHRNTCYKPDLTGEYAGDFNKIVACRENASANTFDRDDSSERIVVSKKVDLSLDADATKAMKFDFSNDPIPLDASDLYLQVVYRGPLGPDAESAEQDVVVVGTKDISEPTYFSYFNASDYIHIGGTVYTRTQVASRQDLLAQVRPVECVTGSPGSLRLVDGCLAPFSMSMLLSFADLSDPTVRVDSMPSRRYLRFVFLTDGAARPAGARRGSGHGSVPKLQIVMTGRQPLALLNQQSICLPLDPFDVNPGQNQLYFDSLIYDSLQTSKLRAIDGYFEVSCVFNGDGSAPGAPDDRADKMDNLDPDAGEDKPFTVTIKSTFTTP